MACFAATVIILFFFDIPNYDRTSRQDGQHRDDATSLWLGLQMAVRALCSPHSSRLPPRQALPLGSPPHGVDDEEEEERTKFEEEEETATSSLCWAREREKKKDRVRSNNAAPGLETEGKMWGGEES
ncbi:hypothetical protein MTO96_014183 [Rhipicephalus appendiculatus]